ncbi:MAG TPA: hypothetical protein PLC34_00390 [Burkholderiaceae bacterium]|nr:hypothetical protein [Burkholderiaceae bacterium]
MLSLLRSGDSVLDAKFDQRVENIRMAMLECLRNVLPSEELEHVRARVMYGSDVQSLWYVRSDMMSLLASTHGETVAREQMDVLSGMFKGLVPAGLHSRPAGLMRR